MPPPCGHARGEIAHAQSVGERPLLGGRDLLRSGGTGRDLSRPCDPPDLAQPGRRPANDTIVRIVAARMSKNPRRLFSSSTIAAAGGGKKIGAEGGRPTRPPDGYTLLAGSVSTHSFAPITTPKLAYDPIKDFAPVSLFAPGAECAGRRGPSCRPPNVARAGEARQGEPGARLN